VRRYISIAIDPKTYNHFFMVTYAVSPEDCCAKDLDEDTWAEKHGMECHWIWIEGETRRRFGSQIALWVDKERQ
jgi:hypothetical protein